MPRSRALIFFAPFALASIVFATDASTACPRASSSPERAFPVIDVHCTLELRYLGSYHPDGKYRPFGLLDELFDVQKSGRSALRPPEVPPQWNLHPREKVVLEFGTSVHREAHVRHDSLFAQWRDDIVTLAYGREKALVLPRYIATDRLGRVIVGDPAASAVHVLDGEAPFRIVIGRDTRLHSVAGIATDEQSNIYVGDEEAELVVVFDRYGRWLRDIGRYDEKEGMFHQLSGIAIDRERGLLYVTDAASDALLVLDLDGRFVMRIGGRRHEHGVAFEHPIGVIAKHDSVYVADADGTRIQVLNPEGALVRTLQTKLPRQPRSHISLDVDSDQNLYIALEQDSSLHILRVSGEAVGVVGTGGEKRGQFAGVSGLSIQDDQLYVSDAGNRRVQVFAISHAEEGAAR